MKKIRILILGVTIGLVISTVIGVYAANTFNSKDISYTNENTNVNNVQDAVDELYDKSSKYKYANLADVVSVGDYVAYDAGEWATSADKPTSQGEFGGYIEGENKANSVEWCYQSDRLTTLKGWQVFSMDINTKTVTLIHAGHPECYYHQYSSSGFTCQSVTNLNNRATSVYLNRDYADSAHNMNKEEADQNILREIGDPYYLATARDSVSLWDSRFAGDYYNHSFGIRPVVVLKSNILTTGKGTDMVGQEAWTLVKP